jgi:hypothetical protein
MAKQRRWTEAEYKAIYRWWKELKRIGNYKSKASELGVSHGCLAMAISRARAKFDDTYGGSIT